jgi:hypothetical protein
MLLFHSFHFSSEIDIIESALVNSMHHENVYMQVKFVELNYDQMQLSKIENANVRMGI